MVMDTFKAHLMDDVAAAMLIGYTVVVKIPSGCRSRVQSLEVWINESFKYILRKYWGYHVVQVVKKRGKEANNNPSFKLNSLTRRDIMNWVHWGYVFLQESKTMNQRSFTFCGITTTNSELVRNDDS